MEKLGIFYYHLVYFTAIGNILCAFGIFCGNLIYFPPFWYFGPRKIWQPWLSDERRNEPFEPLCKNASTAGLPDFSWYSIPKREKYTK
jgi:hypothetical protein